MVGAQGLGDLGASGFGGFQDRGFSLFSVRGLLDKTCGVFLAEMMGGCIVGLVAVKQDGMRRLGLIRVQGLGLRTNWDRHQNACVRTPQACESKPLRN